MAARRARFVSVGVAGAVLAGLLSTMSVVSPQQAVAAADDPTPIVLSQSLGSVPAQPAEEVGKALPAPDWPSAAEATVDLSKAAPGDAGKVTPAPSAPATGDASQVGDVVQVAPAPEAEGATPQLASARLADEETPAPGPSTTDVTAFNNSYTGRP
ncbi:hypothetical protein ACFVYF_15555 [Streptomyces sp. NPDC058274]|uniref:hypothetical protein n=1 Tax=Streptomyces sp. NPDC058274 TaxID=3346416 RepID=UPI0036F08937